MRAAHSPAPAAVTAERPRRSPRQGLWLDLEVAALEGLSLPELRQAGVEFLVLGCSEDEVRWEAERLADFSRQVSRAGLETYLAPWGYGKVLAGDAAVPSLYLHTHPQTLQVDSRGRRLGRACPNDPHFLEWFANAMRTLAWLLEARGFVWDTPGFYHTRGAWGCHCAYCRRLYAAATGEPLPRLLTPEVLSFRRQSLSLFLLAAAAAVKSVDRRLLSVVVPPSPLAPEAGVSGADDWRVLAANSGAEVLGLVAEASRRGDGLQPSEAFRACAQAVHAEGRSLWVTVEAEEVTSLVARDARGLAQALGAEALVWPPMLPLRRPPRP